MVEERFGVAGGGGVVVGRAIEGILFIGVVVESSPQWTSTSMVVGAGGLKRARGVFCCWRGG